MSNETLLLLALQGVLAILTTVGLRWTANIRQEVSEIRADLRAVTEASIKLAGRVDGIEHEAEVLGSRVERVGSVASDVRLDVGAIKSRLDMCPSCAKPGAVRDGYGTGYSRTRGELP